MRLFHVLHCQSGESRGAIKKAPTGSGLPRTWLWLHQLFFWPRWNFRWNCLNQKGFWTTEQRSIGLVAFKQNKLKKHKECFFHAGRWELKRGTGHPVINFEEFWSRLIWKKFPGLSGGHVLSPSSPRSEQKTEATDWKGKQTGRIASFLSVTPLLLLDSLAIIHLKSPSLGICSLSPLAQKKLG